MDRMIDEEISFLEESCERLRLEIQNRSTPIANTRVRDSGIATMASANGSYHDAHSPAAEDTVVSLGIRQSDSPAIIGNSDGVTLRKTGAQKKRGPASHVANTQYLESAINHSDAHPLRANALDHVTADALHQTPAHAHRPLERTERFEVNADAESALPRRIDRIEDDYKEKRDHDKKTTAKCNIKPATFDGTHSWLDDKSHFDACASLNNWNYKEKGLYCVVKRSGTRDIRKRVFRNRTTV